MAAKTPILDTTLELEDQHFWMTPMLHHFRFHFGTIDIRLADQRLLCAGYHQHLVKFLCRTRLRIEFRYPDNITLSYRILKTT